MNIPSNSIKIYPAATRSPKFDYTANLNIEQNTTTNMTSVVDYPNYFINTPELTVTGSEDSATLTLGMCNGVIQGYRFNIIDNISGIKPSTTAYKVILRLNTKMTTIAPTDNPSFSIRELNGGDAEATDTKVDEFTALKLLVVEQSEELGENDLLIATNTTGGINSSDFVYPENCIKYKLENATIDISNDIGLGDTYAGRFDRWLENSFIIDDGELN